MNRKLDNDMGPSAERIDALIDSFNSDATSDPNIDPELIEIAATIRGLRRRRTVVWPENTGAVPRKMAVRLAGLAGAIDASPTSNGSFFATEPAHPAIGWDQDEASDSWPDDEPTDD